MVQYREEKIFNIPKELILRREMLELYPDYFTWVNKCYTENRQCIIAYSGEKIVGFIILKKSDKGIKICQIYVKNHCRGQGIGSQLLERAEKYAEKETCRRIYVTVSKKLADVRKFFLEAKYQLIDLTMLGDVVLEKKNGENKEESYALLALKPKYWKLILEGKKTVELRKKIWKRNVSHVVVYLSQPISSIGGIVTVAEVDSGDKKRLKNLYLSKIAITEKAYDEYLSNTEEANILILERVSAFETPICLSTIGLKKPPMNYCYLTKEQFAALVDKGVKSYERIY